MSENKGYITIISLFVMAILMFMGIFLLYLSYLERTIVDSAIQADQCFYSGEGKIYLCLNDERYYKEEILPRIKHYLIFGREGDFPKGNRIKIAEEDLLIQNDNPYVTMEISQKDDKLRGCLNTNSIYINSKKNIEGYFNILNSFYEMGFPILREDLFEEEEKEEFNAFLSETIREFDHLVVDNKTVINSIGNERIDVVFSEDGQKVSVELYRPKERFPHERFVLNSEELFLVVKREKGIQPFVSILNDFSDKDKKVKGILYVQGNLIINDQINIEGILMIDGGEIVCNSLGKPSVSGITFLNEYKGRIDDLSERIEFSFDKRLIRKFGIYIDNYINPKLIAIKEKR